jgi:hypothetical protein
MHLVSITSSTSISISASASTSTSTNCAREQQQQEKQQNNKSLSCKEAGEQISLLMQNRHSLTLGFRQEEDEDEDSALVLLEEEPIPRTSIPPQRELIRRQGRALSEPLLDLGYLASTMMPPKLVKNIGGVRPTYLRNYKHQRRDSCGF